MQSKAIDAELVRRAQAGEQGSLETLMECVRQQVRPQIRRAIRDEHESEDLAQETLLNVLGSLGRLQRIERFWPWVFRIATSTIHQHYRYVSRRRVVLLSVVGGGAFEMCEAGRSEGSCRLEDKERKDMLLSALSDVDERHRLVLVLRFFGEMPHKETACLLGCSEPSARVVLLRAKQALRWALTRRGSMARPRKEGLDADTRYQGLRTGGLVHQSSTAHTSTCSSVFGTSLQRSLLTSQSTLENLW